jgi:hypothetical protein
MVDIKLISAIIGVSKQLRNIMKAFTTDTYGRDHYFGRKDTKVPKSSKERRGKKAAIRQGSRTAIVSDLNGGACS